MDVLLCALIITKVASFCEFTHGDQEIVKRLTFLLYAGPKGMSFHRLVDLPVDVCFNSGDNLFSTFALFVRLSQVFHDYYRFSGEA